jgi:hypothetical protein
MRIVSFDPSYKQIGCFIYVYEKNIKNCVEMEAIHFSNEYDSSYEDKFLYELNTWLKRIFNDDMHLLVEYTNVPRFKSAVSINRVIGVIYATLHPFIVSWREISMPTIYSHFKINNDSKKYELHKILLESLPDSLLLRKILLTKNIMKLERIPKEKLPSDCLDAYALIKYILDFNSQ